MALDNVSRNDEDPRPAVHQRRLSVDSKASFQREHGFPPDRNLLSDALFRAFDTPANAVLLVIEEGADRRRIKHRLKQNSKHPFLYSVIFFLSSSHLNYSP